VRSAPTPRPGPRRLLVRVRAVAVNPLDALVQSNGRVMYGWLRYPVVPGEDLAGEVVATGAGVRRFAVGDRILAYAVGLERRRDAVAESGFQRFAVVDEALAAPIPPGVPFEDADVLPLAVSTAAAALFERGQLALRMPTPDGRADAAPLPVPGDSRSAPATPADTAPPLSPGDEVVVVWGASTSVGGNAVQLARAAGYRVVATASPRNHATARELGAEAVIDYRASDAVDAVVRAVGGRPVAGVLAVAVGSAEPCVGIAARTGARRLALASPSVSFYDQPRRGGLTLSRVRLFGRLMGGMTALFARCARHRIRARFVWGGSVANSPVGPMLWCEHLPAALNDGRHRFHPRPRVVGDGLAAIQGAIDELRRGVSAEKLVVRLPDE